MGSQVAEEQSTASRGGRVLRLPKEGERVLAPTRRPDGTLRKPVRIRAGYVPQDEVAIYQSKGALLRKELELEVPPGYDPELNSKPKSKSAKRNERKKEKKQQAALAPVADKGKNLAEQDTTEPDSAEQRIEHAEVVREQMNMLSISSTPATSCPSTDPADCPRLDSSGPDIDKRIRALKKKIRLAEAQLQGDPQSLKPEQKEKLEKIQGWQDELKTLEDNKSSSTR